MSFVESIDICLRNSIPLLFLGLTLLGMSFSSSGGLALQPSILQGIMPWSGNATESAIDFTKNDLLLGNSDSFFWFLMPLFGLISVGICVLLNYVALILISILAFVYSGVSQWLRRYDAP